MTVYKRGGIWWYKFYFARRCIRESSKSRSKAVATAAERQRRRELELGFHNMTDIREQRVWSLKDIIDEYLVGYRLRFRSISFAEYALGHVSRLLGSNLALDINEPAVLRYQENRLREGAAPKSINDEVRFLLKMLGDFGEILRARLHKKKQLKLPVPIKVGKVYSSIETQNLSAKAKQSRSPHIYPAFMLARNAALRDSEIRSLTWGQIDLERKFLQILKAKSNAGTGRIIPLNSQLYDALIQHRLWYVKRFSEVRNEWYLFPYGRPMPLDPTRHVTTLKSAWNSIRKGAKVTGRWHDNRHTLITEMAESGAGDETIMEISGHGSRRMLRHYSHIRMEAKRVAVEAAITGRRDAYK